MAELITKDQVIDWFRCYGHMDKPIPYDVLVTDIQAMDHVDAANLQQNNNCAAIAQQWIPVTEWLPDRTLPPPDVLVYHDLGCGMFVDRAWYNYDKHRWWSVLGTNLKVTHWMPLPEPPKEVPENETL